MIKFSKFSILALFTVVALGFTACKKDNPVPEEDQEEFDGTTITFTAGHFHGTEFHSEGDPFTVSFTSNNAGATPASINLEEGESYLMEISIFRKGVDISDEFDAADHQFFFTGAPAAVLDYEYKDANLGLKGLLTVKSMASGGFDLNVVLRHGLNKQHTSAQAWNSTNYAQAGGTDDFNRTFKIFTVEGDGHSHDH